MPPPDGGGGGGGEAYRRALLKKLRAAVAAKTRVDAGDPSLQPAQVEKGRKASVDDALRALKREGLGRGDELVKLALARGVAEGDALMAAAATRRSRAPAATSRDVPTASTSAARAHRHRRGHHHHYHHPDDVRSADAVTAPPARVISGHVRGACKRAIAALHALAKAGATDAAAASAACAALLNDRKLVDDAADAFQVAKALWAVATIRRDLVVPTDADAKREQHDALSALIRALASRLAARLRGVAPAMDPRGVATAFWAVATLAETDAMDDADARTFAAPLLEAIDAARRIKGDDRYSTDARSTDDARLLSGYNAVDAAQVLFACATLRAPPSVAVAAALATRVARSEPADAGGGTAAPGAPSAGAKEITAAMWSLASLSSDGLLSAAAAAAGEADAKTTAAAAADAAALEAAIEALARRAAEEAFAESTASSSSSSASAFGSRAVAECAWAAEKLGRDAATPGGSSHLGTSFGTRRSSSAEQKTSSSSSSALGALRALAEALAARVGAALDAHAPRAVARTLALCASLCVAGDDESADDAAFRARIVPLAVPLATRALALATSKGRKDVEKRIITLKRKRDDDSEEDANDLASRPSADDLVAALEAVAKLGLAEEESRGAEKLDTARVAKKLVRAALSAALTRPAEVGGGALSTESRPEKDPSVKESSTGASRVGWSTPRSARSGAGSLARTPGGVMRASPPPKKKKTRTGELKRVRRRSARRTARCSIVCFGAAPRRRARRTRTGSRSSAARWRRSATRCEPPARPGRRRPNASTTPTKRPRRCSRSRP